MTKKIDRSKLKTEQQNIHSMTLDRESVSGILKIINNEDKTVAEAVENAIPEIEKVVNMAVETIKSGHRIFYIGAGTSGRLGVLDAAECYPTFSIPKYLFTGIIAGGDDALKTSIEGAEDNAENAIKDLTEAGFEKGDLLIGITSSSTTPYVLSGQEYAKKLECKTVFLICNPTQLIEVETDVIISINVGNEVITGSTRMKSGSATKMVLNMISTATMVRLGKVYGNLMVDLKAVSEKLVDRGVRIVSMVTSLNYKESKLLIEKANLEVKPAIVMHLRKCNYNCAVKLLEKYDNFLRPIIELDD
jgi:N-acetylmuramic acid 6-phosphate etherase|tara:strand:+ start:7442 stop:8353 length:912 start_codon:yes stop_codon:yes gene_type:complete